MSPFERLQAETEAQVAVRPLPDCLTIPTTPDAAFLSAVLRDSTMWPAGFEWNFSNPDCCAIGLACHIWHLQTTLFRSRSDVLREAFSLSLDQTLYVFFGLGLGKRQKDVTPTDVADALDAAIASQVQS